MAKDKPPGTSPTQIRFTDQDKAKIEAIRERFGLPSAAAAIRYSVETVYRTLDIPAKKPRKKPE